MSTRKPPRKNYTKEFKVEAIKLALEGKKSQAEICRDLGIHPQMMSRWIRDFKTAQASAEAAFPGKGKLSPQDQQIKDLEEELRQVKMERDILKKATAYFAKLLP